MTQAPCKWILEIPGGFCGDGAVLFGVCVCVCGACCRVQRSVGKGMVQDCEKLESACGKIPGQDTEENKETKRYSW